MSGFVSVCVSILYMHGYVHVYVLQKLHVGCCDMNDANVLQMFPVSLLPFPVSTMATPETGHSSLLCKPLLGLFDVLPVLVNLRAALSVSSMCGSRKMDELCCPWCHT